MRGWQAGARGQKLKGPPCRSVRLAGAFIPFILPLASSQSVVQKGRAHTAGRPRAGVLVVS